MPKKMNSMGSTMGAMVTHSRAVRPIVMYDWYGVMNDRMPEICGDRPCSVLIRPCSVCTSWLPRLLRVPVASDCTLSTCATMPATALLICCEAWSAVVLAFDTTELRLLTSGSDDAEGRLGTLYADSAPSMSFMVEMLVAMPWMLVAMPENVAVWLPSVLPRPSTTGLTLEIDPSIVPTLLTTTVRLELRRVMAALARVTRSVSAPTSVVGAARTFVKPNVMAWLELMPKKHIRLRAENISKHRDGPSYKQRGVPADQAKQNDKDGGEPALARGVTLGLGDALAAALARAAAHPAHAADRRQDQTNDNAGADVECERLPKKERDVRIDSRKYFNKHGTNA